MREILVDLRELSFAYGDGPSSGLNGITLQLRGGEAVGLVGPNGAGKSTLLLTLAGVLPPRSGQGLVADCNLFAKSDRRRLPRHVGLVFQDSDDQLFNPSVAEEVAFGPLNLGCTPAEADERVHRALAAVRLSGYEARVPYQLSGGEKRRVALAAVIAMEPALLLLDEPTLCLDPRGRREFAAVLSGLPQARLVASHDLEFVLSTCQRAVILDQGRIHADGPPRHLFADQDLMERHGLEVPALLQRAAT